MTMNKILIIGNLGSDPEMRYTPNGKPVTSFSMATNRRYTTSEGESKEETEWCRISAWNRTAEICNQYLQKGSKVYVEGRLTSRTYVGSDGETRVSLDVSATDVRFIDSRGAGPDGGGSTSESSPQSSGVSDDEEGTGFDDLPW